MKNKISGSALLAICASLALMLGGCSGSSSSASGSTTGATTGSTGGGLGAPTISGFGASPAVSNAGRVVALSWSGTSGDTLLLQPGAIDVTGLSGFNVTPAATTTYTLQATNSAGTTSATTVAKIYDWTALGQTLDGFLSSAAGPDTVTGYSYLLFDDQGTLYSRAGGDQTLTTVEPLASATKMPSVAAIMTLVDDGRLDLDMPVKNYLALDVGFVWPSDKDAITMRMLLSHTSGLPGLGQNQPACLGDPSLTLRQCAQDTANTALVTQPGAQFNYGGCDFQVAGYIATLLALQDWQTFFNDRIGSKLGLTTYTYGGSAVTNPAIASGASSNVVDYVKFLQMLRADGSFGGVQVLSPASVAQMEFNQISGLPIYFAPFPASRDGDYPGYGLGLFMSNPTLYPGSPGPELSDPGLYGTTPWIDNGLRYGAVLIIKDTTATGLDIWDAVRPLIITQLTTS